MTGCRQEEYCSKTKMKKGQDVLIRKKRMSKQQRKRRMKMKRKKMAKRLIENAIISTKEKNEN